jgi:hypothetical protein
MTTAIETARRWTITTENGLTIDGHLPPWATGDPSETDVPLAQFSGRLEDLGHCRYYAGLRLDAANLSEPTGRYQGPAAILCPQLDVRPYSDDPAERVPTVTVEISEGSDVWIEHLDPAGVRELAEKLRAQAAVLDRAADDLDAARADWAANGSAQA